MTTRTVMEDASMQSIYHNARHTVINVEDIKKKRKKSKVLFDKLPVAQLLKLYVFMKPYRLFSSSQLGFTLIHLNSLLTLYIPVF